MAGHGADEPLDARATRKTWRYQRARAKFLARYPLCRPCEAEGRVTLATQVDHILPAQHHPELFWDIEGNWQPICVECHENKTWIENGGLQKEADMKRKARFDKVRAALGQTVR